MKRIIVPVFSLAVLFAVTACTDPDANYERGYGGYPGYAPGYDTPPPVFYAEPGGYGDGYHAHPEHGEHFEHGEHGEHGVQPGARPDYHPPARLPPPAGSPASLGFRPNPPPPPSRRPPELR